MLQVGSQGTWAWRCFCWSEKGRAKCSMGDMCWFNLHSADTQWREDSAAPFWNSVGKRTSILSTRVALASSRNGSSCWTSCKRGLTSKHWKLRSNWWEWSKEAAVKQKDAAQWAVLRRVLLIQSDLGLVLEWRVFLKKILAQGIWFHFLNFHYVHTTERSCFQHTFTSRKLEISMLLYHYLFGGKGANLLQAFVKHFIWPW